MSTRVFLWLLLSLSLLRAIEAAAGVAIAEERLKNIKGLPYSPEWILATVSSGEADGINYEFVAGAEIMAPPYSPKELKGYRRAYTNRGRVPFKYYAAINCDEDGKKHPTGKGRVVVCVINDKDKVLMCKKITPKHMFPDYAMKEANKNTREAYPPGEYDILMFYENKKHKKLNLGAHVKISLEHKTPPSD